MNDERDWIPVEVIWDGGHNVEDDRELRDWPFADQDELANFLSGTLSVPQEDWYLTKRKRKKLRGEER